MQEQLEEADIVLSVVFGAFSMEQPTNVEFGLNIGYPFSEIPYALKSQNEQVCIQPVYNSQTCNVLIFLAYFVQVDRLTVEKQLKRCGSGFGRLTRMCEVLDEML